ncbi:MAG: hypothetical protein GY940_42700, partial [bacterium]|nr:hypothetical protein [bacterium]
LEPGEFVVFWADGLNIGYHTNFKLGQEGEEVALFNSVGLVVDSMQFAPQVSAVSYGRQPDGGPNWYYFDFSTNEAGNTTVGVTGTNMTPVPLVSLPGGFYTGAQTVEITVDSPAAEIKYTLDGSIPNRDSTTYTGPLDIPATAVLRARAFGSDSLGSAVVTHTYFIDETFTLPVVSIATNPDNFFDEDIGIYEKGKNAEEQKPFYGANFWENWERPVNVEYFKPDGTAAFNHEAGVKIFGGTSVDKNQKSLGIYFKEKYGT